jgi:glycosyltransferase involved in cell wall biosynthesis
MGIKQVCMIAYTNYLADVRVRREAETLARNLGYEIKVLALRDGNTASTYMKDGVEVVELNISKYRGKSKLKYVMSYLQFLFLSFIICNKLLFLKKSDIFHVHNMPDFLVFATILPRIMKKKIVLDIHDSLPETYAAKYDGDAKNRFLFKLLCWEEALCCKCASKIICVNHIQRDALIKRGIPAEKMIVSMNVPDHKRFNSIHTKQSKNKSSEKFKLVYHGTITKRLGVDFAIKAVAKLVDKIPGLEFHIFGDGDDVGEFIQLSKVLRIDNIVKFNKMLLLEDLISIISGMDLGIISNRKNTATDLMLPVKMLEYIFLEIPVVAPRLKTIEHYFTEDMISYFEPENIDSLADTILRLWNNETERKEKAQKAKGFLDIYGWEKQQTDLINFYKEI